MYMYVDVCVVFWLYLLPSSLPLLSLLKDLEPFFVESLPAAKVNIMGPEFAESIIYIQSQDEEKNPMWLKS